MVPKTSRRPPPSSEPPDPYVAALRLLAGRDLSAKQLADHLDRRGCDPAAVRAALERLTNDGTVDDRRVARAWARTLLQIRGRGPLRAEREIEARGITRAAAREAVRLVLDDTDTAALLERALARRARHPIQTTADRRRVYAALVRQGFPADLVRQALRRRAAGDGRIG